MAGNGSATDVRLQTKLLIDGEFVDAVDGSVYDVINPAEEEKLASIAEAKEADVERAVESARATFESDEWQNMPARDRGRLLGKLADLVDANADEIARIETLNNGKPYFESRIDLGEVAKVIRYYAGWTDKIHGEVLPAAGPILNYTRREPLGVVGAIVPWNFPLSLATWKVAPALACGNTVVLKPAHETPLSVLKLGELAMEAGFPAGALNVIPGYGTVAGSALVRQPDVDKIAFTGSTEVGQLIMADAAKTVKRVSLELGGKSPNIVMADADIDAAVRGANTGIFYGKGEVCAAGSRLLVQRSIHDEFMEKLVDRAKKMTAGDPFDQKTRLGALVSKRQMERVLDYVERGVKEGAELLTGGKRVDRRGYFVEATVFDKVSADMSIAREEIFGPVLATLSFDDVDEAIDLGNRTIYGLAAGVWTRDVKTAHKLAHGLKAGTIWVNTYNRYDPVSPFGGYKQSGFGRDLGMYALEGYTQIKSIWIDLS